MKPIRRFLSFFLFACPVLMPSGLLADVLISHQGNAVSISNHYIKLEYDLDKGNYNVYNNTNGKKVIQNAYYQIKSHVSFTSSLESGYSHSWQEETVNDELGVGKKLIIESTNKENPNLLLEITLYDGKTFMVLNAGVENQMAYPFYLNEMNPIKSTVFEGYDINKNWMTLDGNGGEPETKVRTDDHLKCWNNLLVTFGENTSRQSLVIGGLTYHEFEKWAEVTKSGNHIEMGLWAEDPIGKRIEPGTKYLPNEKYYVDFITKNPFESLEKYASNLQKAQQVDLSMYYFPSLCLWYSGMTNYGGGPQNNNSAGAVKEMKAVKESGFLKYVPVAIRLVPDNYHTNNQQGWWDDKHWQMYPNEGGGIGPGYRPPYETTEKWGKAVVEMGGIPLIYSQTARRSEDYCYEHPTQMLFNNPNRRLITEGMENTFWIKHRSHSKVEYPRMWWDKGHLPLVSYDFTDSDFIKHMESVYDNLGNGGVRGLMFDYPNTGWCYEGGFDDKYATTAAVYRRIFELPHDRLPKPNYVHERNLARGSDVALGAVASQRTMGDTDKLNPPMISRPGLRWYKNRVVVNYDTDAKNPNHILPENQDGLRAMYTMCYVASGRLLLGLSFARMSQEQLYVLSRIYPFHTNHQSARPVDAFTGVEFPEIYDFKVNNDWHQLTLYNTKLKSGEWPTNWQEVNKEFGNELDENKVVLNLGAQNVDGGLELDPASTYYIYDFWNDSFLGKYNGNDELEQLLRPGEARMLSIHKVERNPQFLSTNRHIMQGFIDMTKYPEWNGKKKVLEGTSSVIGGETYKIIIALNGYKAIKAETAGDATFKVQSIDNKNGLAVLTIDSKENNEIAWKVKFE